MTDYENVWGTDEPEEFEPTDSDKSFMGIMGISDFNDGIADPTYINDIIDCSDLGIYPWGDS